MHSKYLWFFLVPWMGACDGAEPEPEPEPEPIPDKFEVTDVSEAFKREFKYGPHVFRSQAELDAAWANTPFKSRPIDPHEGPKPTYDFSDKMVAGCMLGEGNLCQGPELTQVERIGADTVIHYKRYPYSSSVCHSFSKLYLVFVLVPRADGNVICVRDPWVD